MKAQLITLDGRNNSELEKSTARILKGASWKKQRIAVIVPADEMIASRVYLSHSSLIYPPNNPVFRMLGEGLEVGDAYSQAFAMISEHPELSKWEYILTLEHDNTPPQEGVLMLCESMDKHPELDCIGGLYWTKGMNGVPQIWGDPSDPVLNFRPQVPLVDQVQECNGTGMGFNLWRIKMFKDKKLRRPFFKTIAGKEGVGTQDLYFWTDAKKYGYRCAVDTRVRVGHYDHETKTCW